MITTAILLFYLALILIASFIHRDYSFDGICWSLHYGYSKTLLVVGDLAYIVLTSLLLNSLGYTLSSREVIVVSLLLNLFRVAYIIVFERYMILTNRVLWLLRLASIVIVIMFTLNQFIANALVMLTLIMLGRQRILNPYDDLDVFAGVVSVYLKKYKPEIIFIDTVTDNHVRRRTLRAILIMEVLNRPKAFRIIENLLSFSGLVKSNNLMQVTTKERLNNKQSIRRANHILNKCNKSNPDVFDYAKLYNGTDYANVVKDIDSCCLRMDNK